MASNRNSVKAEARNAVKREREALVLVFSFARQRRSGRRRFVLLCLLLLSFAFLLAVPRGPLTRTLRALTSIVTSLGISSVLVDAIRRMVACFFVLLFFDFCFEQRI